MPDKLKASPFRYIAEKVAAKYFRPQEIDTAISKNLARSECARSNEEIVRLAVEATADYFVATQSEMSADAKLWIANHISTLAEKERT